MPSGRADFIPDILSAVSNRHQSHSRIRSILDVGVGWGKYGVLMREYVGKRDIMEKDEEAWKLRLDGVEISTQYMQQFKRSLYTHLWNVDIREFCAEPETWIHPWNWDMILMIDIIEHLEKEEGHAVLKELLNWTRWLILSTPTRMVKQPVQLFHENEQHISLWSLEDFEEYNLDNVVRNDKQGIILVLKGRLWEERPPKR